MNTTLDSVVSLDGSNIFRCDRKRRGGGVAVYVTSNLTVTVLITTSVPYQFKCLVLDVHAGRTNCTVVGPSRPPNALPCAIVNLSMLLGCLSNQNYWSWET